MIRLLLTGVIGASLCLLALACEDEDEPDDCQIHCAAEEDCQLASDQPFSESRCVRQCREDVEAYDLVGCGDDFLDLLDCQDGLSCNQWNDYSTYCATEINRFDNCMGGQY